ncbi:MAG TPA: hypothetical protein DCE18_12235, partial [Syntrophobacteraceae bacterium]|nr:hypothetical protein [Syntrophobacteraceae bacterium]
PTGQVSIETLSPGDDVLAVDPQGNMVVSHVERVHRTKALPFSVQTDGGPLITTADHPLAFPDGRFVRAGDLQSGNKILNWAGGAFRPTTILDSVPEEMPQVVYNLSVAWPHTFLAAGFVAHNKGGSSSSYHSSSSTSSSSEEAPWWFFLIFFGIFGLVFFILIAAVVSAFSKKKRKT